MTRTRSKLPYPLRGATQMTIIHVNSYSQAQRLFSSNSRYIKDT